MGYKLISSSIPQAFHPLLLLIFIISSLLIPTASGDTDLKFNCSSTSGTYTENSTYEQNLNNLLNDLHGNAPPNHGFWNGSSGHHRDRLYGLALCRGDVTPDDCGACLSSATGSITVQCPHNRAAIFWREHCHVKYSHRDFFGEIDKGNKFNMENRDSVASPGAFSTAAIGLLSNLSTNATDQTTNNNYMFARGKTNEPQEGVDIYGMVQCTRDLSKGNCTSCLDGAVKELPRFTTRNTTFPKGGRTVTGSCNVRYETYDFGFPN